MALGRKISVIEESEPSRIFPIQSHAFSKEYPDTSLNYKVIINLEKPFLVELY
jgi:hypothetical protein